MNEISEFEKLLLELSHMSIGDLPKDLTENHKNIWRAFYIGKEIAKIEYLRATPPTEGEEAK